MAVLINVLATVAGLAIKKTASTYALAAPALHETVIDQRGAVGDLRANSSLRAVAQLSSQRQASLGYGSRNSSWYWHRRNAWKCDV